MLSGKRITPEARPNPSDVGRSRFPPSAFQMDNPDERMLIVSDSGIGMTADELMENLGTIAHSGARAFVDAANKGENLTEIIGQFGVGFYSAFMVAEWIRVETRSYSPEGSAATWYSDGSDVFTIEPSDKTQRGTDVIIKLNEDAAEFAQESRLREVIKRHSDFIAYPIFLGDSQEQVNRQSAIWRQQPRQVEEKEYEAFYQQMTLDFDPLLTHAHMVVDAPVQMYTLLFIPSNPEQKIFSLRKQPGLKLYSRKVLIQEYCLDLLVDPGYRRNNRCGDHFYLEHIVTDSDHLLVGLHIGDPVYEFPDNW